MRCFEGGVSRAWRAAKLPGQRWYPDIHHQISHPHSGQAHCITSLDPKLSIAEIFVRNILHRNWSSPLTMSKLLPGVNDRDILWCPHLMHTVAVTAGSRGRGGAIILLELEPELELLTHFIFSEWGMGRRENRGDDTSRQGYLHIMENLNFTGSF